MVAPRESWFLTFGRDQDGGAAAAADARDQAPRADAAVEERACAAELGQREPTEDERGLVLHEQNRRVPRTQNRRDP